MVVYSFLASYLGYNLNANLTQLLEFKVSVLTMCCFKIKSM